MPTGVQFDELHVTCVETFEGIEAIADAWLALEKKCSHRLNYFQTLAWCRSWVQHFGAGDENARPFIHALWRRDALIAVWPLMRSGSARFRRIENLGEPYSQYCNLLHDPELMDDAASRVLINAVLQSDCDVAVFNGVPETSTLSRILRRFSSVAAAENQSSILDLSGYASSDQYVSQLGKLQKRNRNRRRNHLARLGELRFEVIWPDHPDFAALVRVGLDMKRTWLKETGRWGSGLTSPNSEAFFANLTGCSERLEGACLSVLKVGERVAALELGFIRNGHYYAYMGAFEREIAHLSPGKAQMDMTVCWLIDRGVYAYDLLANSAEYKKYWSNRSEPLKTFAVPLSWKGRLYAGAWLPTLRPALKRAFYSVPLYFRRFATTLQGASCFLLCL